MNEKFLLVEGNVVKMTKCLIDLSQSLRCIKRDFKEKIKENQPLVIRINISRKRNK